MCDCLTPPQGIQWNSWLHVDFQDERNAARYLELLATLPRATDRRAEKLLRTMPLHMDAPLIYVPQLSIWTPPRTIVFGQELAFRWELMRFAGLAGFAAASAAETKPDPKNPCEPCSEQKCGPDVTAQVLKAVEKTKTSFASWSDEKKRGACGALNSSTKTPQGEMMAAVAWDIVELHNRGWLIPFRPDCAAPPKCQDTVQVGDQCYYGGSANYVIFGVMCKLCHDYWGWDPRALEYSETAMLALVTAYKGPIPLVRKASGNYQISKKWASAGYNGWPSASAPPGDRPDCAPSCPQGYTGSDFRVNWHYLWTTDAQRGPVTMGNTF